MASLYSKLQATWTTGGISFRLLCGAVFVGMFTGLPDSHHFPIQRKVGAHEHCARQQPLFWFLQNFLLDFWQHPSPVLILDTLCICSLTFLSSQEFSVSLFHEQRRKAFRFLFPNEEKNYRNSLPTKA